MSKAIAVIAGVLAAALGLMVIVGWHTHDARLLQVHPSFIAMVYNTALSFLLCGVALVSLATGRRPPAIPCGAIVLALGASGVVQHVLGVELGIDQLFMTHYNTVGTTHPGRMAPNTCVCFVLSGAAILLMGRAARPGWRPLVVGLLGSVIFALGTIALVGYLAGMRTYGWGRFLPMAVHTAGGFVLVGAGLMALAWRDVAPEEARAPRWLPVPIGIGVVAATLCLWQPLVAHEHDQIDRLIGANAASVREAILARMGARISSLIGMGRRWEARGRPAREAWEADAGSIVRDDAGLRAVAWVDPSDRVRWVATRPGPGGAPGRAFELSARQRLALASARARRPAMVLHAPGGDGELWICVPILTGAGFDGFILGILRFRDSLASLVGPDIAPGYGIVIYEGGREFARRDVAAGPLAAGWGRDEGIDLPGVAWRARVWPGPEELASASSSGPEATLVAGFLMAGLLALAVHLAQEAVRRARETASANRGLEHEIGERRRVEGTLQATAEDLRRTLEAIRQAVAQQSSTSAEMLASTTQQEEAAQQQASAVAETVTTVEQVAQLAARTAQRARDVGESVRRTVEVGRAGREAVKDSGQAMGAVRAQAGSTAGAILALAKRAQAIGEIIAAVDDIAEQTNLLALNAALEASRSGEHGRGFAIVAREVKELAAQSKKSTVHVRQILGEIQKGTHAAVLSTEQGIEAAAAAARVIAQAGETIEVLAGTLAEAERAAAQIVASAGQQSSGMTQVNLAMKNLDEVARQNVAVIRQFEQAARDLNALSVRLANLTAH